MDTERAIQVLIADDQPVVRSGLGAFLRAFADLHLVGEACSGEEAVAQCEALAPDVVLMDLVMPGMGGVAATAAVRAACPNTRVIALTSFANDGLVQEALKAGATSYLLKHISHTELAEAIRAAHAGRTTLSPEATQALIRATTAPPRPGHDLTPREREVLALMVEGLSNPEIAGRLVIGESTAKTHVSSIIAKLGVSGRTEAVALTIQQKLLG